MRAKSIVLFLALRLSNAFVIKQSHAIRQSFVKRMPSELRVSFR